MSGFCVQLIKFESEIQGNFFPSTIPSKDVFVVVFFSRNQFVDQDGECVTDVCYVYRFSFLFRVSTTTITIMLKCINKLDFFFIWNDILNNEQMMERKKFQIQTKGSWVLYRTFMMSG